MNAESAAIALHAALRETGETPEYAGSLTGPNDSRHSRSHDLTWYWYSSWDNLPPVTQARFRAIATCVLNAGA
jgi:hypothetical protein